MSDDRVSEPRRLHPGSVVIGFLRSAPQTLVGVPAILAVASDVGWSTVLLVAAIGVTISAGIAWLKWRRFTYTLGDDALVIESGLLSRNRRTIPFDRVQDVDIERKLLQRLFGLARVSLETGGAGSDEAMLDSVSRAEAERLRAVIRGAARAAVTPAGFAVDALEGAPRGAARPLFAMDLGRVLTFGLFNFSLVWLAVLFGALNYVDDLLPWDMFDPREWIAIEQRTHARERITLPLIGAALLLFGVLGVAAGVLRTVVRDYGFTLSEEDGRLRRVRGLTTRSEAVIALRRVQLALIEGGWLRRALGWQGLQLQTLGGSSDAGGRQDAAPFARLAEVDAILAEAGLDRPDPATLRRVSSGHVLRSAVKHVGLPFVLLALGGLAFAPVWLGLALLPIPLAAALLSRRFHRYRNEGGTLAIARGVTTQRLWIVPERRIQAVTIRRTWLQRRLGLATVAPDTAGAKGARPRISDIAAADAWRLAEALSAGRAQPFTASPAASAAPAAG